MLDITHNHFSLCVVRLVVCVFIDMRSRNFVSDGISINLAMSTRALAALKDVGLDETVLESTIPMKARMIHELDGRRWAYPYGTKHEVSKISMILSYRENM